jgi:hypothetical protein
MLTRLFRSRRPVATSVLCLLVAGNVALAWSLLNPGQSLTPAANANAEFQPASEYLMVPAQLTSANQDIIYVIDTRSGNLSALAYDRQRGIEAIAPLRLSEFFERARQGQ